LLAAAALGAQAQPFPSRPIKVEVTTPAGVTPDVTARIVGNKLAQVWHSPVIVDNRPGAGGTIAADVAAKAAPDGYTVLYAPNPVPTMAPFLYTKLPYSQSDLRPVAIVAQLGFVLLANKSLPVSDLKELAAYVRAHPGQVTYASYGIGSGTHLIMERIEADLQMKLLHVPYKSSPVPDLLAGRVQLLLEPYGGSGVEALKTGRLKALGVTLNARSPSLPDVPAISEVVKGFESPGWLGFWLPAKTPESIVRKYREGIAKVMADPEVQARFRELSIVPVDIGPEAMAQAIAQESAYWGPLIARLGIKLD
jgi:tripartite-type tricarboxylate transporter receptor subunit TctC